MLVGLVTTLNTTDLNKRALNTTGINSRALNKRNLSCTALNSGVLDTGEVSTRMAEVLDSTVDVLTVPRLLSIWVTTVYDSLQQSTTVCDSLPQSATVYHSLRQSPTVCDSLR